MIAEEVNPVRLFDTVREPFRCSAGVPWAIVPLIKEVAEEYRKIGFLAIDGRFDLGKIRRLVNVRDNQYPFGGVHDWVNSKVLG